MNKIAFFSPKQPFLCTHICRCILWAVVQSCPSITSKMAWRIFMKFFTCDPCGWWKAPVGQFRVPYLRLLAVFRFLSGIPYILMYSLSVDYFWNGLAYFIEILDLCFRLVNDGTRRFTNIIEKKLTFWQIN